MKYEYNEKFLSFFFDRVLTAVIKINKSNDKAYMLVIQRRMNSKKLYCLIVM
jgi:hypothetical protein